MVQGKTIQVLENFDPEKDYSIKIRKQVKDALMLLEKGKTYRLNDLVLKYDGKLSKKKNLVNTRSIFKHMMRDGKAIGIIEELKKDPISFENFCSLDTVSYMRRQLAETKYKHKEAKVKHSGGGTKRNYSLHLWNFNTWLNGKEMTVQKTYQLKDNLQKIESVKVRLDSVEDFLEAYQSSNTKTSAFEKMIKLYLMDDMHKNKSIGNMQNILTAIKAYFSRNESPIQVHFNFNVDYEDTTEVKVGLMTLDELIIMLTEGKPSTTEKGVILCKFHAGLDNSTFVDRFNYEAFPQLCEYFETDRFEEWNLKKCPAMINITRIKVGFRHVSCLDKDAISQLQKVLALREKKTGRKMEKGEAIFLNQKNMPITDRWVSELIPKLAERSGIQKKYNTKLNKKNEKTSHELRDLLKSTLLSCGAKAYACQHLIGHMPQDSYEKEAILYPDKIREEFMKSSAKINVFSNFSSFVQNGDNIDVIREELNQVKEELHTKKQQKTDEEKLVFSLLDDDRFKEKIVDILKQNMKLEEE